MNLHLTLDAGTGYHGYVNQWQPIVDTSGDRAVFLERYGEASRDNVIQFLAFDDGQSEFHLFLRAVRAGKRALGARNHFLGNVGAGQQPVPADDGGCRQRFAG